MREPWEVVDEICAKCKRSCCVTCESCDSISENSDDGEYDIDCLLHGDIFMHLGKVRCSGKPGKKPPCKTYERREDL